VNWLLMATMQVSAIILVAMGMVWLLRRRSASLRHAVIVIAMACASIAPALGYVMPSWPSSLVPYFMKMPVAPIYETFATSPPRQVAANPPTQGVRYARSTSTTPDSAQGQSRNWRDGVPSAIRAAYFVYIAGVVFFLLRLMIGLLRLRWIAAKAEPLRNSQWQQRATAIAIAYGLRRTVKLLRSPSPVLATWGTLNPQVLLPAGAEAWHKERIRAVLLHELAHIRRHDWAIQVLAGALRSVYWFNPLLWLAFARLRQESEQACDDAAIAQGEDHAEYAGHLLALARSLNGGGFPLLPAAPSMARSSTLRQRIASVLDPAIPRGPATTRSLMVASATMLILTAAVSACDGMHATGDDKTQPALQLTEVPTEAVTHPPAETDSVREIPISSRPAVDATPATANAVATTATGVREAPSSGPDKSRGREPLTPSNVTADILKLVNSALADESLAVLDEVQRPITGLHHLQRLAQAVADDEGRNPAVQAASYAEIINALKNTATFASNITSAPRGAQLSKQKIDQLAMALRERAEDLAEVTMPTPRVSTVIVSTPERRAAVSALDLAQSTLRNTAFVGPRSNSWLFNELDTLEQAAQSVLSDDGTSESRFVVKLYALKGALQSTFRNADNIARRPRVSSDVLSHATELSASVRRVSNQLDAALSQPWKSLDQDIPRQ
jgi:beta-lactamase regulating signal transducer with metallopeptidase domain